MRIHSILIQNYKVISNVNVTNLPNFVLLASENGVGKSTIFEAICIVKSLIGPYNNSENQWARQKLNNSIRQGETEFRIELEIEGTSPQEIAIMTQPRCRVGIRGFFNVGQIQTENLGTPEDIQRVSQLFNGWRRTPGIGAIDLIPSYRRFPIGEVALQSTKINVEQIFNQRIAQSENKFNDIKQLMVRFAAHDALKPDEPSMLTPAITLISDLLSKTVKVDFDSTTLFPTLTLSPPIEGVDIDALSDGEKELVMTYVGLYAMSFSNSIILFDEPDLHLHTSLQQAVLNHLMTMSNEGNQLFLSTHSVEMIGETPDDQIFHLKPFTTGSQLEHLGSESDKVKIFQQLGASKYTYVNFKKIVFVEGPSDYLILKLASPKEYKLRFQAVGGIGSLTTDILDKASTVQSFFMIRDRDFFDDSKITSLESKYSNKIKYLKRRHIENYILDSDELFTIYDKQETKKYDSKEKMLDQLFKISELQFEKTLAEYYLAKNPGNTYPDAVKFQPNKTAEDMVNDTFSKTHSRLTIKIQNIGADISALRTELKSDWKNKWMIYASGKDILTIFGNTEFSPGKSVDDLRELVSAKWDENKNLPSDIKDILKEFFEA